MTEAHYLAICDACHAVLSAPDAGMERVAIPWLHVIREHPIILANLDNLDEPAAPGAARRRWLRSARHTAGWLRQFGKATRSSAPWFGPAALSGPRDVLFVSHFLNASLAGRADDFYFGDLPNELATYGYSAAIALLNPSGQPGARFDDAWRDCGVPRVILSDSMGVGAELGFLRRLRAESRRLAARARAEPPGLKRRVLARAAQEALSGSARRTLRMVTQVGELVTRLKPRAVVVTHEGHAWERITFAAARAAVPGVLCIGYQHAALFRLQHAIRQKLAAPYNPDLILTSGGVGQAQLQNAPGLKDVQVVVLGSNRFSKVRSARTRHPQKACLVIPEGVLGECHLLFEFSLACARLCPDIQFVWRLHPLVTFDVLVAQNRKFRDLPKNIVLSTAPFERDLDACRWALYRGTTAIVQAVGAGLRPMYFREPGEMTIDPLYDLAAWRVDVETPAEFQRAAQDDLRDTDDEPMLAAERYCARMFASFDCRVLADALADPGRRAAGPS